MLGWVASAICRPLSAGPALPALIGDDDLAKQHQRDDDPERQVAREAGPQLAKSMSSIMTTNRNSTATAPT